MASIGGVFGGGAETGEYYYNAEEEDIEMAAPQQPTHDENKMKKDVGGNRRALQEISNLVTFYQKEGGKQQPQKNITKRLGALSLANNDQVEAENKTKTQHGEEVRDGNIIAAANGVAPEPAVTKQARAQKKVTYKAEQETVIIISSDEEGDTKNDNDKKKKLLLGGNKGKNRKKKVHSLTSVLTARSKAACGLTNGPKPQIVDIDAEDIDNELAVVEYVEDIYTFYKLSEEENRICDYMKWQCNINEKMRMILIDWLVEVHNKFELMPESLYLTIDIVDRFLSRKVVSRKDLQLLGISSMLLACKYEEIWAPEVNDFVCISDMAYSDEDILVMEKTILEKLEWDLTVATPYVFLVRFIKATVPSADKEMENMAFFLAETALMYYHIVVSYRPSRIAASAVYAALHTLKRKPIWTATLQHYTGYSEDQIKECAQMLVNLHLAAPASKVKAVYRKFSSPDRGSVALLPPPVNSPEQQGQSS